MKLRIALFLVIVLALIPLAVQAQTGPSLPEPIPAELEAADGLVLQGDFYPASGDVQRPGILMMHMNGGNRAQWRQALPDLIAANYNVLNVDLRGHGRTRGATGWATAQTDTLAWLDWLSAQPTVDGTNIAIIGASIGSNLSLIGCAAYENCRAVAAFSPGLDYFGVTTQGALENMGEREVWLGAAYGDTYSADTVVALAGASSNEATLELHLFPGRSHGTTLMLTWTNIVPDMVRWLERAFVVAE